MSAIVSIGVIALVAVLQVDGYRRMVAVQRKQISAAANALVRMVDQQIDSSLGPLLALRNVVDDPAPDVLRQRLAEVQARHPELPGFVALDARGGVLAAVGTAGADWAPAMRAPPLSLLGATVRVAIGTTTPPSMRVLVATRAAEPAAIGTLIDADGVRDGMTHMMLARGTLAVFSPEGRLFVANREGISPHSHDAWNNEGHAPADEDSDHFHARVASARYPFVVVVTVDRAGVFEEWMRQAQPSMLGGLALIVLLNVGAGVFTRAYRHQVRLVEALSRTTRHLGDVQRTGHIGLWEADLSTGTIAWSGHVHEITGFPPERMEGRQGTYFKLIHPEDQPGMVAWLRRFEQGDGPYDVEHRLCRPDGREVQVVLRGARITDEGGASILTGTITEITALHETRLRLRDSDRDLAASEAAYRQLLARVPLPLVIVRDGLIEYANLFAERRLGREDRSLLGRDAADFLDSETLEAIGRGGESGNITAWLEPEEGMPFEAELALSQVRDGSRGTLVIMRDVTEQRRYEERLNHQATHDELTGLPNRRSLRETLQRLIARTALDDSGLMVLFIDLDHFKVINDALGHALGDQVLRDITLRLGDALFGEGHVGRFGGDEFVAMLPFTGPVAQALQVLPRIQAAIEEPLEVGGTVQRLRCSIGVAFATRDGADADTLIRNADTAMYDAKRSGRHTWKRYSPDMHAVAMARLTVLSRLSGAHLDDELALVWQTQHAGDDGRVIGVEALLRWPSAPGDLDMPDRLVPLLEETGAIVQIGQWVLREACRQQRRIAELLGPDCRIAVNISAQQLVNADLVAEVRRALEETGAPASSLELELTESAFMQEPERAIQTLHELRAMGVSIALDDFGTGYSNLMYLSRLPLDKVKIDRHFTSALLQEDVDASICRSIVFLARNLRLEVVAEGVETPWQRRWLMAEGCTAMQGWLFSRPVPLDELGAQVAPADPVAS